MKGDKKNPQFVNLSWDLNWSPVPNATLETGLGQFYIDVHVSYQTSFPIDRIAQQTTNMEDLFSVSLKTTHVS